jgi:hypothetical protein
MNELGVLAERMEAEYRPRFQAIDVEIFMWGGIVDGLPLWRTDYGIGVELALPQPWSLSAGSPYCHLVTETKRPWGRRQRRRTVDAVEDDMRQRLDQWLTAPWASPGPHPPGAFVYFDDPQRSEAR